MREMTLTRLAELLELTERPGKECAFNRVVLDSRQARSGDLFLPFQGRYVDGHQFVPAALAQGAAALVQRERFTAESKLQKGAVLPVADVREALHRLAGTVRAESATHFIAITGSNGKTTLKELLHHLLDGSVDCGCSPGNLNSMQGVPLTLINHLKDEEWFIMEAGASQPGEIGRISRLIRPEMAVITNVGYAHAGLLGGLAGVQRAKGELWEGLSPDGIAIVPLDDELVTATAAELPQRVTCTLESERVADFQGELLNLLPDGHYHLRLEGEEFRCPLPGKHGAALTLIAWTMARTMGVAGNEVVQRLATAHAVSGRFVIQQTPYGRVIDDSYNASPESMMAALATMADIEVKGRRIAVLAAMRELGEWSAQLHRQVATFASELPIDHFMILGEDARELFLGLTGSRELFQEPEELLAELQKTATAADLLLFKGSNHYRLDQIFRELQK